MAFDELLNLQYFSILDNDVQSLPTKLFQPTPSLGQANFRHNQITSFANDTFIGLNRLEQLNLDDNKIKLIEPFSFADLVSLQKLFLNKVMVNFKTTFKTF